MDICPDPGRVQVPAEFLNAIKRLDGGSDYEMTREWLPFYAKQKTKTTKQKQTKKQNKKTGSKEMAG